ncbi:hypothetical protein ACFL3F_01875 [Planctomycetota bacterium]
MKKTVVLGMMVVAVLWVGTVSLGKEKARDKSQGNQKQASLDKIAWQEELKAMTPEQQRIAKAQKAFETAMVPWLEIRLVAKEENAVKTLAAIDKMIATKEKQLQRRLASLEAGKAGGQAEPKAKREGKGKKKVKEN